MNACESTECVDIETRIYFCVAIECAEFCTKFETSNLVFVVYRSRTARNVPIFSHN